MGNWVIGPNEFENNNCVFMFLPVFTVCTHLNSPKRRSDQLKVKLPVWL